ncbi:DUF3182 family protein, partial [Pseudomonas aeruginosa]|uniref:DUF3182 family protein n=1 Tax=Pseudomonas aeruginosa TaxID=287 RepID=UPI003F811529
MQFGFVAAAELQLLDFRQPARQGQVALHFVFGGRYEPELHQRGPLYLVPTRTLVGRETAVRLGVNSDEDLLGGFVEHAFIAGKAIVHP